MINFIKNIFYANSSPAHHTETRSAWDEFDFNVHWHFWPNQYDSHESLLRMELLRKQYCYKIKFIFTLFFLVVAKSRLSANVVLNSKEKRNRIYLIRPGTDLNRWPPVIGTFIKVLIHQSDSDSI